ncbi:MAG: glycosyltransferase family 4 protein [Phycisphaerae bacterium]|nr:glycosyltransferase family 4 protein [Phycisphaerae bacterium]
MTTAVSGIDRISQDTQPAVRPLRVLFALPGLHRVVRGAEVAFESIARRVAVADGFDVTMIGSGPADAEAPYRYRRARCISRERFEHFPSLPYLRDHYGYEELSFAPGLYRALKRDAFDVTVTCGYPYTNWVLRARRDHDRRPRHVFVTQNGDWAMRSDQWEYRYFDCDGLVCTNPDYFDEHRKRWPSVLIPNGVDPSVFKPGEATRHALGLPTDRPVVLMVSALAPFKRVLEGIRSAARVKEIFLMIAGDGEQRAQVQALGDDLMPGRFKLATLPRSQMPDLYRSADVFLHMSQDEPSANAYIEALASGLPIVTHDRRVTQWTMEDTAVLVDTSDESAVERGIIAALDRRGGDYVEARRQLVARRFSWDAIAEQYCRFFQAVAELD